MDAASQSAADRAFELIAELRPGQTHPNLVRLRNAMGDDDNDDVMLVAQPRSDLIDLVSASILSEHRARTIMMQVLKVLGHLHANGIVHRNVKAQNVIMLADGSISLTGADYASYVPKNGHVTGRLGTPGFVAPEILLEQGYNEKVDIFSSGVVFYYMIMGRVPFAGNDLMSVLRRTLSCRVRFHRQPISEPAKAFTGRLLSKDPGVRPSCAEAMADPFMKMGVSLRGG